MFRAIFNFIFGKKLSGVITISEEPIEQKEEKKAFGPPYKFSMTAVNLIKKFEGLRLSAYKDGGGVWTIGYGYTPGVKEGMLITRERAEDLLKIYLYNQDKELNKILKDVKLLSQMQYDAIVSFAYNVGCSAIMTSTFLKKIKQGNFVGAANELVRVDQTGAYHGWIYDNGKKVNGLIKRRKEEKEFFLRGSNIS